MGFMYKGQKIPTGGGTDITAGDGLSKDGDTLNVDNPVRGIMTQEEFDALPEAQKASGTYFVDDGATCHGGEVYDGQERVIGTWFGKPIYRKCLELTASGDRLSTTPPTHEKITALKFVPYGKIEFFDNMARTNTDVCRCWYDRESNLIYMEVSPSFTVSTVILIVEYTKTTDMTQTQEVSA